MRPLVLVAALLVGTSAKAAHAETWLGLDKYVDVCALIVLCESEVSDNVLRYRVKETWKGVYSPQLFYKTPEEGYLQTGTWHGNENPRNGQQTIFFFTASNHPSWTKGKLLDHSTAFQITDGKLVYAPTGVNRKEYTVEDFRKAVLSRVRDEFAESLQRRILGRVSVEGGVPKPAATTR